MADKTRVLNNINVLSLFDGMSCGMLALQRAGITVKNYDAYEIDKYAIQVSKHNFPNIKQHGDVFDTDYKQYENIDILMGGSPCTYWSIAQRKNRETEASGLGWDLFQQYIKALNTVKPKYFIYENNYSISKDIRKSIDEAFGIEAIMINSALLSAQQRKRLYWVGCRQDDGTYRQVPINQPPNLGIKVKDILDSGKAWTDKSYCLTKSYNGAVIWNTLERKQRTMIAEPLETDFTPKKVGALPRPNGELSNSQGFRLCSVDNKGVSLTANGGGAGAKTGLYAVPFNSQKEHNKNSLCYSVSDKTVNIKGNTYPINLSDGLYQFRKLSVAECKKLQTVPDTFDFSVVSDNQAYKCLGNGWTVDVIAWLLEAIKATNIKE